MSTLYVDNLQPNLGSQVDIPNLKPLAGSVLQVVHGHWGKNQVVTSTTSGSFVPTGMSASITPMSSSSKLLIGWSIQGNIYYAGSGAQGAQFQMYRDGASLGAYGGNASSAAFVYAAFNQSHTDLYFKASDEKLITAVSTAPTTFEIYFARYNNAAVKIQNHDGESHITIMEIAQ